MTSAYDQHLPRTPANFAPLSPLGFLERAAEVYPERLAIVHGALRQTWGQTYRRCTQLAAALSQRGIGVGDTVALLAPVGSVPEPTGRGGRRPIDTLAPHLREIREAVRSREEVTAAQLAARTGQTMLDALSNASELVESGWLADGDGGTFRLPGRSPR